MSSRLRPACKVDPNRSPTSIDIVSAIAGASVFERGADVAVAIFFYSVTVTAYG